MEYQISLFQSEPAIHETWICQSPVMLGSRHKINTGDKVIVISRHKDTWINLDIIVLLHNESRVEAIESFFIKHFYILTKGKK